MKTDVSRQAAATLTAIGRELRRAEDLTWDDPEFQAWERGQVGELEIDQAVLTEVGGWVRRFAAAPGYALTAADLGVHRSPMVGLIDDHPTICDGPRGEEHCFDMGAMSLGASDYPPPEHTTHGPLLLGPEPPVVGERQQAEVAW